MHSKFVDPEAVLHDIYENEIAELRAALAAAETWKQRVRIKREIRRADRQLHRKVLGWLMTWFS